MITSGAKLLSQWRMGPWGICVDQCTGACMGKCFNLAVCCELA